MKNFQQNAGAMRGQHQHDHTAGPGPNDHSAAPVPSGRAGHGVQSPHPTSQTAHHPTNHATPPAAAGAHQHDQIPLHNDRDEELGYLFQQMRQLTGADLNTLASHLQTTPQILTAFECGEYDAFPPWAETVRIVSSLTLLVNIDCEPILDRISTKPHQQGPRNYGTDLSQQQARRQPQPQAHAQNQSPRPSQSQSQSQTRSGSSSQSNSSSQAQSSRVAHNGTHTTRQADPRNQHAAHPAQENTRSDTHTDTRLDTHGAPMAHAQPAAYAPQTRQARQPRQAPVVTSQHIEKVQLAAVHSSKFNPRSIGMFAIPVIMIVAALLAFNIGQKNGFTGPLGKHAKAGWELFNFGAKKDGLTWITVEDPRSRKADKLPIDN